MLRSVIIFLIGTARSVRLFLTNFCCPMNPALGSRVYMLVLDLEDSIEMRKKKSGIKPEEYRWQLLSAH